MSIGFGPVVAQKSLNLNGLPPVGGTLRQPIVHFCWKVHVPKPVASAPEHEYRISLYPPIGAMPPHINPSHWVLAPAVEPLAKAGGPGFPLPVRGAFCAVPRGAGNVGF